MALDLDRYNNRIQGWTSGALQDLKASGAGLGIIHRANSPSKGASLSKLKAKLHFEAGTADRVGFSLSRSLIYTHKGAGRGQAGTAGSTWYNKKGEQRETASASKGKAATGNRVAKPWFNNFIESPAGADDLATIAAEELGDAIINKMLIN